MHIVKVSINNFRTFLDFELHINPNLEIIA